MKTYYLLILVLLLGCAPKVSTENIDLLNGYWVIAEAKAPNGENRPYLGTVEVDYFELDSIRGFRKKLKPLLDNQFNSTNDKVDFSISFEGKMCIITYFRQQHSWQEEVVSLSKEELQLKDARGVVFRYKRYLP
ncbi:MAG: hypothetical protein ACPGAA_04940 [Flavobacteriaceae bacterium]